jgi:GNAT superfamily N-acetyltransferase
MKLIDATTDDASSLAALHTAVAEDLCRRYGKGHWCYPSTEKGVLLSMKRGRVLVVRQRGTIVGTLILSKRKPWAIDRAYFTLCRTPLYLTNMAVVPAMQKKGIGRSMLAEAIEVARKWPADSICLDAYDADAGAGDFYRKAGFRELARVSYRNTPLIYFEMMLRARFTPGA